VGHSSSLRTYWTTDALRDAVRQVRAGAPFHIDAWVVLPDHMHCLWTLPEGDADFPGRWRAIKKGKLKGSRQRAELFLTFVIPMDLADDIENGALLVDADGAGSADALAHRPCPAGRQFAEPGTAGMYPSSHKIAAPAVRLSSALNKVLSSPHVMVNAG